MARKVMRSVLLVVLALAAWPAAAPAAEPPWCGTPEADYSADVLPDGTDPTDPAGSFPHIPHYAIGCTLESIAAASGGRMSVEVAGSSALGRDMYRVVINPLDTNARRQAFHTWQEIRRVALTDPARAQALVASSNGAVKVPIFIQGGIHGNEYEGVDAAMQLIERLATTPAGADAEVDELLDHAVLVFNPIQNPDGRIAGESRRGREVRLRRLGLLVLLADAVDLGQLLGADEAVGDERAVDELRPRVRDRRDDARPAEGECG